MATGLFNFKQVNQAIQQGGWPNQATPSVEYLVVAGGGAGGFEGGTNVGAGGGGAGGLLSGVVAVATGSAITVTVGGGASVHPFVYDSKPMDRDSCFNAVEVIKIAQPSLNAACELRK